MHWIYLIHKFHNFELNYWNKLTFPRYSNLLRCTCRKERKKDKTFWFLKITWFFWDRKNKSGPETLWRKTQEFLDNQNINTGQVRKDPELLCNCLVISICHSGPDTLMVYDSNYVVISSIWPRPGGSIWVMERERERERERGQQEESFYRWSYHCKKDNNPKKKESFIHKKQTIWV